MEIASMSGNAIIKTSLPPVLDLMAVQKPPIDPEELHKFEREVTSRLVARFQGVLGHKEREAFEAGTLPAALKGKFDEIILTEARVLGWRVLLSRPVLRRMAQWGESVSNGPNLNKQLGEALALYTSVIHGKAKLPIDDRYWPNTKTTAMPEIRALLTQYKSAFAGRNDWPRPKEAQSWFRQRIEQPADTFRFLKSRRTSFFGYLEYIVDSATAQRLYCGELRPVELFNKWGAWAANISEERFRQMVSRIGSEKL
jgi:hypothetical protein